VIAMPETILKFAGENEQISEFHIRLIKNKSVCFKLLFNENEIQ